MKKFIVLIVIMISVVFYDSCTHSSNKMLLKKGDLNKDGSIEYESSKVHGNYINVIKSIYNIKYHYNIKISDSGELQHVLKYENKFYGKDDDLDSYRSLQFLVTDTAGEYGPTLFGNSIKGYYSDTFLVNNVINNKNTKKRIIPLSKEETKLFQLIDSLTKENNIKCAQLDTLKILGWFKYIF